MNLKPGQRIRCKKSFVAYKEYEGFTFEVAENDPEKKSFSVYHIKQDGTQVVLPFWYGEFDLYFEPVTIPKCDCGFISGISAA